MSMFILAISCLTTSNLPWFVDLTFQVLWNIALYSIGLYFHYQSHPQLGIVFALALFLHSSWSYSPQISRSILGTYRPVEFIFHCPIFLSFLTVHGGSQDKNTEVVWHSFPSDHVLSELSTMVCPCVALHSMADSGCTSLHSQHQFKKFLSCKSTPAFMVCRLFDYGHSDWCFLTVILICISNN